MWQAIAIVALVAATAGWTTVAVLALRDSPTAVASPSETPEPLGTEEPTLPPVADTHDAPELEVLLPGTLDETELQVQSWTGDSILTDDAWSTSMTTFLASAGKTPRDLRGAQVYDPAQTLDGSIGVYRVAGIEPVALRDALVAAWKVDYPEMVVSTVTLDGKEVTKLDFGEDSIATYLYVRDDLVFDVTFDETLASAALAALPEPGASPSGQPASAAP